MKPIIGITTFNEDKIRRRYCSVSRNYVDSVYMAGGTPLLLPIMNAVEGETEYLNIMDGLLLTGGEDVSTYLYGESPIKEVTQMSEERDSHELRLYLEALKRGMPILGICRGAQLMNVASGGSLHQDINVQISGSAEHNRRDIPVDNLYHIVHVHDDSRLSHIFKTGEIRVNSFHHQAVKKCGKNLRVNAVSEDGIVEGIEAVDGSFTLGVQWHPEDLAKRYQESLSLFQAFVDEARSFNIYKTLEKSGQR